MFGPDFRGSWRSLYKPPIEKRTADLQWETCSWYHSYEQTRGTLESSSGLRNVPFVELKRTVDHLFLDCMRLDSIFIL